MSDFEAYVLAENMARLYNASAYFRQNQHREQFLWNPAETLPLSSTTEWMTFCTDSLNKIHLSL